ncbi:coiled-coil domain-containing protein 57 [Pogoniulus pusillus]|uniref:coiled-coil domain-containing protein 57 n=1 Tax=Pogoniulus pusillus TaxID=488313 RepID=UPI0030B93B26
MKQEELRRAGVPSRRGQKREAAMPAGPELGGQHLAARRHARGHWAGAGQRRRRAVPSGGRGRGCHGDRADPCPHPPPQAGGAAAAGAGRGLQPAPEGACRFVPGGAEPPLLPSGGRGAAQRRRMPRLGLQSTRHKEPSHTAKEKFAMPAPVEEAQVKQLKNLKQQIRELQTRHKSLEIELCRREWSHSACLREKDALIRKYKQQLALAAERECILEQNKVEAEHDWQQLCENSESDQCQKSEDLTQRLSSAGEQVFQYDDKTSLSKDAPTLEIKKLQEQNANLRAAITQMRKEMESLDEHTSSSLPPAENRQLAEQGDNACHRTLNSGSLITNKISAGTTLSKGSSVVSGCVVNSDTEKRPNPKIPEEKMVDFGQQLPDVGPGGVLQYDVNCTLQGMQNKLKEAARKISVLNQEKQQLIEIGNRLRAELGKEGLWHPASSKHCTVCLTSGSLLPRELVRRMRCQLSALKHLQHSLVTQVQQDFSTKNHGPEQRKTDPSSRIVHSQPLQQRLSQSQQLHLPLSRAYNCCQDTWQTLEMGSSPSGLSPLKNTDQAVEFEVIQSTEQSEESQQNSKAKDKLEMPDADLTVRGTRLAVQEKLKSRNVSGLTHKTYPINPKISSKMAKIRNYNIKD